MEPTTDRGKGHYNWNITTQSQIVVCKARKLIWPVFKNLYLFRDQEETSGNYPDGLSNLCEQLDRIISEMVYIFLQKNWKWSLL